jgi:hypothetical protein
MAMDKGNPKRKKYQVKGPERPPDPKLPSPPDLKIGIVYTIVCTECGPLDRTGNRLKAVLLEESHKSAHGLVRID